MKRLVSIVVNTEELGHSTEEELKWIQNDKMYLTKDNIHNYEKKIIIKVVRVCV